jgi:hypothetical protein
MTGEEIDCHVAFHLLGIGGAQQDYYGQRIFRKLKGARNRFVKETPSHHIACGDEHEGKDEYHPQGAGETDKLLYGFPHYIQGTHEPLPKSF